MGGLEPQPLKVVSEPDSLSGPLVPRNRRRVGARALGHGAQTPLDCWPVVAGGPSPRSVRDRDRRRRPVSVARRPQLSMHADRLPRTVACGEAKRKLAVRGVGSHRGRRSVGSCLVNRRVTCCDEKPKGAMSMSYRSELSSGEEQVDPATWAGAVPVAHGIAPRVRIGGSRWFNLLWLLPIGFVLLIVGIASAKGLRNVGSVEHFIVRHPGVVDSGAGPQTAALPIWIGVQHFFNLFLLIFIIRSGIQILSDHPRLYWTRHSTPGRDWFRVQKPVPEDPLWTAKQDSISLPGQVGLPGIRHSIGLARWWHLASTPSGWSTASSSMSCCSPPASGGG